MKKCKKEDTKFYHNASKSADSGPQTMIQVQQGQWIHCRHQLFLETKLQHLSAMPG